MRCSRRDFIMTSAAAGAAGAVARLAALPAGRVGGAADPRLETLSDWIQADPDTRKRGLQQCLQRIRELEPSIHAWVQVHPEGPTADGPLSTIPFGVKDILET